VHDFSGRELPLGIQFDGVALLFDFTFRVKTEDAEKVAEEVPPTEALFSEGLRDAAERLSRLSATVLRSPHAPDSVGIVAVTTSSPHIIGSASAARGVLGLCRSGAMAYARSRPVIRYNAVRLEFSGSGSQDLDDRAKAALADAVRSVAGEATYVVGRELVIPVG
jgi:hypothetical protein